MSTGRALLAPLACAVLACCGTPPEDAPVPAASAAVPCAAHAAGPAAPALPAGAPLPGLSLYQLGSTFTDQDGVARPLASFRGKPTVVLLFYGTCTSVCPTLLADVKRLDDALPAAARAETQYLLVTFDPERDDVGRLRAIAEGHAYDGARFHLLRGTPDAVRELANVLGVQYRPTQDGEFAHSTVITLLDRDGVEVFRSEGIAQPVGPMAQHVAALAR